MMREELQKANITYLLCSRTTHAAMVVIALEDSSQSKFITICLSSGAKSLRKMAC